MNANIMKTQIFHKIKYELRSLSVTQGHLKISKSSCSAIQFLFNVQSFQNFSRMTKL